MDSHLMEDFRAFVHMRTQKTGLSHRWLLALAQSRNERQPLTDMRARIAGLL